MPPASTTSSPSGIRAQWAAGVTTYSAWAPPATIPITRSPSQGVATADPTVSTTPANSMPGMSGGAPGGAVGERRQDPGEGEGELVALGGRVVLLEGVHGVFEGQKGARVDLQGEVEVDGAAAALFGVEVDLPVLAQRVRLEEMALVVDV